MLSYSVSYLASPSLRAHRTNIPAEHSSRSTPTNSGLPPIVLICIAGTGGTSLLLQSDPLEKPRDLTLLLPSLPARSGTSSGKNNNKVFFIVLGSISLYLYVRRLRERTKRNEHREKAWQFKDMKRNGLRPTLNTEGAGLPTPGHTPIHISDPVLMNEATSSPRYPTRAFHW